MTSSQIKLVKKLLTGHCLVKHYTFSRKICYRLINKDGVSIEFIQCRTVENLHRYPKPRQRIYKKDAFGRLTLNLNTVRRLHGRCMIKQLYKIRHQLQESDAIHKKRKPLQKEKIITTGSLF